MKPSATTAAVVLAVTSVVSAQVPRQPPPPAPVERTRPPVRVQETEHDVVLRGCLRGRRLELADSPSSDAAVRAFGSSEFILEGPRELLQKLEREHDGHYVEIDGTVTLAVASAGDDRAVSTTRLGPARIGLSQSSPDAPSGMPRLKVEAFSRLADGCINRGRVYHAPRQ